MKKKFVSMIFMCGHGGVHGYGMRGGKVSGGAGGQGQQAAEGVSGENSKYEEFLTVDVFDSQANYQGIQSGWFAKIVKTNLIWS